MLLEISRLILWGILIGGLILVLLIMALSPFFVKIMREQEAEDERRRQERREELRRMKAENEERIRKNFEQKEQKGKDDEKESDL